jgi:hypothetical protein
LLSSSRIASSVALGVGGFVDGRLKAVHVAFSVIPKKTRDKPKKNKRIEKNNVQLSRYTE